MSDSSRPRKPRIYPRSRRYPTISKILLKLNFRKTEKKEIKVKKCGRPRKIKMEEDKKQEESEEKQESLECTQDINQ